MPGGDRRAGLGPPKSTGTATPIQQDVVSDVDLLPSGVPEFRGHHTYFGEMPRRQVPGALSMGPPITSVTFRLGPEGVSGNPEATGESQDERDLRDSPVPARRALGLRR